MKTITVLIGIVCLALSLNMANAQQDNSANIDPAQKEIEHLKQIIATLQAKIVALTEENRLLRKLVGETANQDATAAPAQSTDNKPAPTKTTISNTGDEVETGYWLTSSSKKRHNKNCQYYKNSKGRFCKPDEGIACKVCGG